jgi:hypothetical protein
MVSEVGPLRRDCASLLAFDLRGEQKETAIDGRNYIIRHGRVQAGKSRPGKSDRMRIINLCSLLASDPEDVGRPICGMGRPGK